MNTLAHQPGRARRFAAARAGWVVLVAVFAVTGCGKSHADVSGSVSYHGRPVVYGTVSVIGADQMTYYGHIQPDGTFTVPRVPVGPARVGVYSPDPYYELPVPQSVKLQMEQARKESGVEAPPKPPKGQWFKIPQKYADPLTSGVTAEVVSPTTPLELKLD
ncbi:hypothetical protein VT84_16170 [Gemmata sp. SH-PL17]|uniref:hypothetical protein n=1 Tax=Gemmata sp. SH-PL17 TaxID=1630693 RepID=UPI0004BB648B|nr:hypothetical protein [Gemmata sp. SH-PL17]AMV25935.1 hypothetical protein VT84_16170 [Gemmata sp. SH-PL17]